MSCLICIPYDDSVSENPVGGESKWGLGVGLGYRVFSMSGWYWGADIFIGPHVVGQAEKFYNTTATGWNADADPDRDHIFEFELLRVDYVF